MSEKSDELPVETAAEHAVLPSDSDAEEFAEKIMARAASLTGVRIDRGSFLRAELKKRCPEVDADYAVETTPLEAGVSPSDIDAIALAVVDFETQKCAAISFLAGIPGGVAMAGTIPADLAQYFAHALSGCGRSCWRWSGCGRDRSERGQSGRGGVWDLLRVAKEGKEGCSA